MKQIIVKVDFFKVGCIRDKTWEFGLKSEHCHVLLQIIVNE